MVAYLCYLFRHKWHVLRWGIRLRVPLWRLIVHDSSKFRSDEFIPYRRAFYPKTGREQEENQAAFDVAWLKHQNRNDHHWQYWVLLTDKGERKTLPMPMPAAREMLADWLGASLMHNPDPKAVVHWYVKNEGRMDIHPTTKAWLEFMLFHWLQCEA